MSKRLVVEPDVERGRKLERRSIVEWLEKDPLGQPVISKALAEAIKAGEHRKP